MKVGGDGGKERAEGGWCRKSREEVGGQESGGGSFLRGKTKKKRVGAEKIVGAIVGWIGTWLVAPGHYKTPCYVRGPGSASIARCTRSFFFFFRASTPRMHTHGAARGFLRVTRRAQRLRVYTYVCIQAAISMRYFQPRLRFDISRSGSPTGNPGHVDVYEYATITRTIYL